MESLLDGYEQIEKKLNYTFRDKSFMLQAFSHESFTANDICPNYDSLDFVGDGIINYLLCRHLFREAGGQFSANEIEFFTNTLKSNCCFATVSIRHGIHNFFRLMDTKLNGSLASFVKFVQKNQCQPINDVMINIMRRDIEFICETRPKSAIAELSGMDHEAYFSKPETIGPGKIMVQVILPNYENQTFSSISRDPNLAKWGAAKSALLQLKKQFNEYVPYKSNEFIK
uniref:Dicer-1-like protein n=1 Tax=Mayetiola destructor TaxID=39758 RepID=D1MLM3_MAYDE|nr:dicer-1-like protein [Mayetiola destructor]